MDDLTYLTLLRLYARQSHLIDSGDAPGWSTTFTADGTFDSPSYAAPVRGRAALEDFAQAFTAGDEDAGTRTRHVVSTVDVVEAPVVEPGVVQVRAYLQIVTTPRDSTSRLVRHTVLHDELVRVDGSWRVRHRRVTRDDQPHPTGEDLA